MASASPDNQPQAPSQNDVFLARPLTFGSVWRETIALFRRKGLGFMRALLLPVGKMLLGVYGSLGFCLGFTQWAEQAGLVGASPGMGIVLLLVVLGMAGFFLFLLFQGFWQYLVYWASLCRNVQESIEGRTVDFKGAYTAVAQHKKGVLLRWVSLVLVLLPLPPLLAAFGLPMLAGLLHAPVEVIALLFLFGLLLGGILGLGWLAAMVLLTYGFQALALESDETTLIPLMKRSVAITLKRPWLTLGLQVSLFIVTNYVLTIPLVSLLRISRLTLPVDDLHRWLGGVMAGSWQETLQQMPLDGASAQLMAQLQAQQASLPQLATDAVMGVVIPLLWLPLGTMAFTLVYLHWRNNEQDEDRQSER